MTNTNENTAAIVREDKLEIARLRGVVSANRAADLPTSGGTNTAIACVAFVTVLGLSFATGFYSSAQSITKDCDSLKSFRVGTSAYTCTK
jgi:uncharacterized protein HemX